MNNSIAAFQVNCCNEWDHFNPKGKELETDKISKLSESYTNIAIFILITHLVQNNFSRECPEKEIGPYKMWHHQHIIEAVEGGVLMTDIVDYQPPMGFMGAIANQLIIKKQLNEIFTFRTIKFEEYFGRF